MLIITYALTMILLKKRISSFSICIKKRDEIKFGKTTSKLAIFTHISLTTEYIRSLWYIHRNISQETNVIPGHVSKHINVIAKILHILYHFKNNRTVNEYIYFFILIMIMNE